ncbi:MAG: glycosyltransferase [Patescibacteria group bacterium]|jgi:glycosyltransferase involved in cell wall biosynthesis
MKRVLWFGFYDHSFPRTRVLIAELRKRGIAVDECRVDPKRSRRKFSEILALSKSYRGVSYDAVVVGYPGANVVWLAKLLFRAPVVYDAGFSVYQSEVEERKTCKPHSLRAALLYAMEWVTIRLADAVVLDTRAHVRYFCDLFRVSEKKFLLVPVGADAELFTPSSEASPSDGVFTVLFYGSFIPLHGVDTILDAATRLLPRKDVRFRLIGNGQTAERMRRLADERALTNVVFVGSLPQTSKDSASVLGEIRKADVLLGIFGSGRKAQMQVPLKVFEAIACGKPVITADTPAVRELLLPGQDVCTVPASDGAALAAAILRLKEDAALRVSLAAHGRATFEKRFQPEHLCDSFLSEMTRHLF